MTDATTETWPDLPPLVDERGYQACRVYIRTLVDRGITDDERTEHGALLLKLRRACELYEKAMPGHSRTLVIQPCDCGVCGECRQRAEATNLVTIALDAGNRAEAAIEARDYAQRGWSKAMRAAALWKRLAKRLRQSALHASGLVRANSFRLQKGRERIAELQDALDHETRTGKYAPVPVPESEARYPGETMWPSQHDNIHAVRRAWLNSREESSERIAKLERDFASANADRNAERAKHGDTHRELISAYAEIKALKVALETTLVNQGAGTSPYARSQPSDACEIEQWKAHAEGAWEDLEEARAEAKAWREAWGAFGPQTPAEVALFEQVGKRVDRETAAHERKFRDRLAKRVDLLGKRLHVKRAEAAHWLVLTYTTTVLEQSHARMAKMLDAAREVVRKYEFGYGVTPPMLALKKALGLEP